MAPASNPQQAPDTIVQNIEVTRERLASTIDQIVDRANPKNVASRTAADVKAHFVDENGSPKFEAIIPVVGGVVGVIAVLVVLRKIVK